MVNIAKYKPEMCKTADDLLASGKSLAAVCAVLDITRTTLYEWRDSNPDFRDAIDRGLQKAQAAWEEMGEAGIRYAKNFGAAPWIFTMKNRFREDYKEEKEPKSTGDTVLEKFLDKLTD